MKLEGAVAEIDEDLKRLRANLSAASQGSGDARPFVEGILADMAAAAGGREIL
jgi:hypothetical protein